MSKRINVNPDHYKLAGRERPGHAVPKPAKGLTSDESARARWIERKNKKERTRSEK
jgi:hypothetical protein